MALWHSHNSSGLHSPSDAVSSVATQCSKILLLLFTRLRLLLCLVQGTGADVKNEMLYTKFGINYNALPEQFKKVGF